MDIKEYRNKTAEIDDRIISLFAERMTLSEEIGRYKSENNINAYDKKWENDRIYEVLQDTPEKLRDYVPQLYSMIFDFDRSYQKRLTGKKTGLADRIQTAIEKTPKLFPETASVACQGIEGANSQYACEKFFRTPNIMFLSSFEAVFSAIEKGLCRYGVIPIENSTAGSVNTVYDLMNRHNFSIVRSTRIKIEHNLLAKPGVALEDIREIYSHEQAISQSSDFLKQLKNVRIIPCENTAVAAKMVAESEKTDIAAIASRECEKYYRLNCLQNSIQNNDNNYTRFICISRETEIYPGADRTSLMVTLLHEPGSLYKFISKLYVMGINLLKLESRPLPRREFEFMFYFDIETSVYSPRLIQLLCELPDACEEFYYLGSYSEII